MKEYNQIYHQLDEPFFPNPYPENSGLSGLQELYPGRPMHVMDRTNDPYEIPSENPEGAKRTFLSSRQNTFQNAEQLIQLTLANGGGDKEKVLIHSVADPSSVINDTNLSDVAMLNSVNNGLGAQQNPMIRGKNPYPVENFEYTGSEIVEQHKTCPKSNYIRNFILGIIFLISIMLLLGFSV